MWLPYMTILPPCPTPFNGSWARPNDLMRYRHLPEQEWFRCPLSQNPCASSMDLGRLSRSTEGVHAFVKAASFSVSKMRNFVSHEILLYLMRYARPWAINPFTPAQNRAQKSTSRERPNYVYIHSSRDHRNVASWITFWKKKHCENVRTMYIYIVRSSRDTLPGITNYVYIHSSSIISKNRGRFRSVSLRV